MNTNFTDNYSIEIELIDQSTVTNLSDLCLLVDDDGDFTSGCRVYAAAEGITFAFGSIIIGGIGPGIIPPGGPKFVALGSKDPATALPVELTKFRAEQKEGFNLISWVTQTEVNSSHFIVQKSIDGLIWEEIDFVHAAGNSDTEIAYQVIDEQLCYDKCYYRLHQVDISGESNYSHVEIIENTQSDDRSTKLSIYPVPVNGRATVDFAADHTGMHRVEIYSGSGAIVYEANVVCVKGNNTFNLNTSTYAAGVYYLILKSVNGEVLNKVGFTK